MLRFGTLLVCILAVSAARRPLPQAKQIGSRIVNGDEASLGQFPWQTALYLLIDGVYYFCGGTIIHEEWIVTSGSCIDEVESAAVQTGIIDIDGNLGEEVRDSVELILHEDFHWETLRHSIGLIKLDRPLIFDEHTSAIPLSEERIEGGVEVVASGWGYTSDNDVDLAKFLNYAYLDTISDEECKVFYGNESIYEEDLCAISKGDLNRGPCAGDTGGPLVASVNTSPVLVGIIDFLSEAGCEAGHPAGFTRISSYIDWIREKTGIPEL